jgi:hypothetical protein
MREKNMDKYEAEQIEEVESREKKLERLCLKQFDKWISMEMN